MAVYRVWWHMSTDMPKIARHFAAINEASLRREREKQTGLMIIKLLSLLVWIITLCHQPRQKAVTF